MAPPRWIDRLNDSRSVTHGVVSTGVVAGLALIEPRRLTTGRRLAYRGVIAAATAWMVWAGLRPRAGIDPFGQRRRAAAAAGAAGAALGLARAGEALDARVHDRLARAGARRPRLWIVIGEAAIAAAGWWASRAADRLDPDVAGFGEGPEAVAVDQP